MNFDGYIIGNFHWKTTKNHTNHHLIAEMRRGEATFIEIIRYINTTRRRLCTSAHFPNTTTTTIIMIVSTRSIIRRGELGRVEDHRSSAIAVL